MSYQTIYTMAANQSLRNRVAACAAQEGAANPESWAQQNSLLWAASPGWSEAWEYAEAVNPGDDHGANEGVITDDMVLAAIQPLVKPPVAEEPV